MFLVLKIKMLNKKQIKLYIARDFIQKSKNAAIGFFLINLIFAFTFFFAPQYSSSQKAKIVICALLICLLSTVRFSICYKFTSKFRFNLAHTANTFKVVYMIAILNAILWSILQLLIFFSNQDNFIAITSVIMVTLAFSANSLATLGIDRPLLLIFNTIIISPVFIFYFFYNTTTFNFELIFGLLIINLIYTFIQSKQVYLDYQAKIINFIELRNLNNALTFSQKKLEEQTLKTFHANRLASLGEMAGGISHEINNPLTIINGMAAILNKNESDPEKTKRIEKIIASADRIAKIVKSMKALSTNSDGTDFYLCRLSDVLENSLDLVNEKFKSTDIDFNLSPIPDVKIRCNKIQISQVIINLLNNANDALENFDGEKIISISFKESTDQIKIKVCNTGDEIPKKIADNLFIPFFTTKPVGKGTGLGLSISKNLMKKHGGDLFYQRIENKNCFTLILPK